jgi:uncharacterized protein (TIGR03492 family)
MVPSRLLCICNGHGEDVIANRILTALHQQVPDLELAAMPLVGEGRCFQDHQIPLVCPTKQLPSGGFIYMDGRQLAKDLQGGLVQLTLAQIRAMGRWAQGGGAILAVGDLVPLLFAWVGGLPYWFVGTAKSEYYLRNEQRRLASLPWYEGRAKSVYLPWERWLMGHRRCLGVVVRDRLTAEHLQTAGLRHVHTGNPMMDGLTPRDRGAGLAPPHPDAYTVVLLPGSRAPEAFLNWQTMVSALAGVQAALAPRPVTFLGAIAPALPLTELEASLRSAGWQPAAATPYPTYHQGQATLQLTQDAYGYCLHQADCAIAMAGTATEQVVGLGKPAFTLPGVGPQFNPHFAEAQTRLLGPSVILVDSPEALGSAMAQVLQDPQKLAQIKANGARRMGSAGAADRIATAMVKRWQTPEAIP